MMYNSISFRLTLWYCLALFVSLFVLGAMIYGFVASEIKKNQIALLAERSERLKEHIRIEKNKLDRDYIWDHRERFHFEDDGIFYLIYNTHKPIMRSNNVPRNLTIPVPTNMGNKTIQVQTPDGYTYQCLISPTIVHKKKNYTFYIITGRSTLYLNKILAPIRILGLILIPIMVLFATIGGWLLARQAMKPVSDLTAAANSITLKNIDQNLPLPKNDQDELGQLAKTFNSMILRIRTGVDSIRRFTADASHELRTPLTIMRGEMEITLRKPRTPLEYQKVINSSLEEISFLEKIINNLLELSRIDADKIHLNLVPVYPGRLMQQVTEFHLNHAKSQKVSITTSPMNDEKKILLDQERIRQVFSNILDNAIKFTPPGGNVNIFMQIEEKIIFTISDTGIGISETDLPHVFDRFYRADKARGREKHNSGLGLSICKWIMEAHQGDIIIQSKINKGTTVRLVFPINLIKEHSTDNLM